MSKSNSWENALQLLMFNNSNAANIGDATGLRGSTVAGSLYVSLHTADPGEAGDQTTNEAAYTSYARVAVVRSGAGWTIAANQVSNAALVTFPAATGGSATCTHFGIGTASSGAGVLLFSGELGTNQGAFVGIAATDIVTVPAHTFAVNDRIVFHALPGTSLPTGITDGTIYFVKTVSGNDMTISTTQGGATLDITADGDGMCFKDVSLAVSNGITPEFGIGTLILIEE